MTERERWTVYPLLFLALGIAVKDKLFNQLTINDVRCKSMVCSTLVVDDPSLNREFRMQAGSMRCQNVICDALVVPDPQNRRQAVLSANANGGMLQLAGNTNELTTLLGNTEQVAGLMFIDMQGTVHAGAVYPPPGMIVPHGAAAQPPGDDDEQPAADEPAPPPEKAETPDAERPAEKR